MIPWWGSSQPTQAEPTIAESLAELGRLFAVVSWRMEMATVEVERLRAKVEATKGVMESAATLLAGLHQRLTDAGTDPVALAAITDDLASSTDALAAAVAANTQ